MGNYINYIHLELSDAHSDFMKTAVILSRYGFMFNCYHRITLEPVKFTLDESVKIFPNALIAYTCTLNAETFSDEIKDFVRANFRSNGGCITRYIIEES